PTPRKEFTVIVQRTGYLCVRKYACVAHWPLLPFLPSYYSRLLRALPLCCFPPLPLSCFPPMSHVPSIPYLPSTGTLLSLPSCVLHRPPFVFTQSFERGVVGQMGSTR